MEKHGTETKGRKSCSKNSNIYGVRDKECQRSVSFDNKEIFDVLSETGHGVNWATLE